MGGISVTTVLYREGSATCWRAPLKRAGGRPVRVPGEEKGCDRVTMRPGDPTPQSSVIPSVVPSYRSIKTPPLKAEPRGEVPPQHKHTNIRGPYSSRRARRESTPDLAHARARHPRACPSRGDCVYHPNLHLGSHVGASPVMAWVGMHMHRVRPHMHARSAGRKARLPPTAITPHATHPRTSKIFTPPQPLSEGMRPCLVMRHR